MIRGLTRVLTFAKIKMMTDTLEKKNKRIRVLIEQRRRDRKRLLLLKKHQKKQNKILNQIKNNK